MRPALPLAARSTDALSDTDGPASTYLDMMRHNANTLTKSFGS